MEVLPDPRTSPAELTVETVRDWTLELTDVERRIVYPNSAVNSRVPKNG